MKKPQILVAGSLAMDQTAVTSVFPREGQTVIGSCFSKSPGGKGANQAVQAALLGADVTLFGKLGIDANAEEIIAVCWKSGVDVNHIVRDREEPSGCSMIILEENPGESVKNRIIVLPGTNMLLNADDAAFLQNSIASYDMVMLQLEIPMAVNELIASYAHADGVPVMLNCAPSAPLSSSFLSHISYISPNEHESFDLTGIEIKHEGSSVDLNKAQKAAEMLHSKGVENVIITLGDAGSVLLSEAGFMHIPAVSGITAVDPTAAGDSFVGAFCTGICCGWKESDALNFASCAAALTVSSPGAMASLPDLQEVMSFMEQHRYDLFDLSGLQS